MLEVSQLSCQRGDRPLFQGLSFAVRSGGLAHITGRNGSGKTTLLRTLCGLTHPAAGEIRWQDRAITAWGDDYRQQLGYVGHGNGIHGELSAAENLRYAVCLGGGRKQEIDATLERLELAPYRQLPSKLLSQGQKRRLALARLLLADKPLWILDEPFTALDAQTVAMMQNVLQQHLANSGLIILTAHHALDLEGVKAQQIGLEHVPN